MAAPPCNVEELTAGIPCTLPFHLSSRASPDESPDSSGAPRDLQFAPAFGQILPGWILGRNQRQAFCAPPRFDLLLAGNRGSNLMKYFVIHEPVDIVPCREALDLTAFVLQGAAINAICDAGV